MAGKAPGQLVLTPLVGPTLESVWTNRGSLELKIEGVGGGEGEGPDEPVGEVIVSGAPTLHPLSTPVPRSAKASTDRLLTSRESGDRGSDTQNFLSAYGCGGRL